MWQKDKFRPIQAANRGQQCGQVAVTTATQQAWQAAEHQPVSPNRVKSDIQEEWVSFRSSTTRSHLDA